MRVGGGRSVYRPFVFSTMQTPFAAPRKAGETIDEHGIITAPAEGERKVYTRGGMAYRNEGGLETVWTYAHDYEPMPVVTVTPPSGTPMTLYYKGHKLVNGQKQMVKGTVSAVVSQPDVYVKGVFEDFPEAWMQGTVTSITAEGATAVFNGLQTLGQLDGTTYYAVGTNGTDLEPFKMTFDLSTMSGHSVNQLLANSQQEDIEAAVWLTDVMVQMTDPLAPIETLPYENTLSTLDDWDMFSVLDANGDRHYWEYYEQQAVYSYNSEEQADDWLFTPAFHLEAGKTYHFSIDAFCSSAAFAEQMEVKMGTDMTAGAMTQEVIASTTIDHETAVAYENKLISVSQTGTYYFGIHATSDPDMASLKVDNLLVEETVLTAPAAVTNLTVTPDAEQPKATISFTAPTKTIGGDGLTGNMTADILRNGQVIKTIENVTPGSSQSYTDDDPELVGADYTYQVVCSNADGKGDKSEAVTVRLVVVRPVPFVADFSADDIFYDFLIIDANDDGFRWEDNTPHAAYTYNPDNAADDYLVTPALKLEAGKKYTVTVNAGSAGYPELFNVKVGREATVEGLSTTLLENCEVEMEDEKDFEAIYAATETGVYYFAVQCVSEADMYQLWINRISVEVAPEGGAPAAPELTATPDAQGALKATVSISAPTQNIDGEALTTNMEKIELMRDGVLVKTYEGVAPGATLSYEDTDFEEAGSHTYQAIPYNAQGIGLKSERQTIYVGLDVPDYVRNVTATDQQTTVLLTWDPVTSTRRNGGVVLTENVQYVVYQCMPGTTILDGEPVAVVNGTQCEVAMNTNEGEQQYQSWVIAARNEAGDKTVTVEVTYAADQLTENNTAKTVITLTESDAAMAENLQAEDKGDEGVSLTWSAPSATTAEYTEDFEDTEAFVPFTVGGVSATEHNGTIGEWTVYDATGLGTYSWQDNITYDNQYAPMGWIPFNMAQAGFPADFAHSGTQAMLSLCIVPDGGFSKTDHWLISPLLPGTEQPLSFYLKAISADYGYETFEVLASKTDNQPGSFSLVEEFMTDATEYEYVSTTLPEGTKYFAIRHTSDDIFGVFLDDVTFTYGSEITGYNIYVDGVLVATVEGGETTYTVPGNTITGGEHEFSVSVTYANGQESKPVSVTASATTGINTIAAEGKPFDVYTLDGKLVRNQTRSLSGLSGVYVINNRKVVVK